MRARTASAAAGRYFAPMERMLLWWDDLDDLFGAGRHYVANAFAGRLDWMRPR